MKISVLKTALPSLKSIFLALVSAIFLVLAFPDFEIWILACFALIPLIIAVEQEKQSFAKSFLIGWLFGTAFFAGSCWWLTFSLINYGGIPTIIAYILLLGATAMVGIFPAVFTAVLSLVLKRFGIWAIFSAPFIWTATEFLRFYSTGNHWNAIGYSQAFSSLFKSLPAIGGVYLVGFFLVFINAAIAFACKKAFETKVGFGKLVYFLPAFCSIILLALFNATSFQNTESSSLQGATKIIVLQVNVPMGGMNYREWIDRRDRHVELAEESLAQLKNERTADKNGKVIVVFPESPMNFGYTTDREFQEYLRDFTTRNNVQVLINASEPAENGNFYNSAVLVNERAEKIAQYDKIHLVPFGEFVPLPSALAKTIPTFAGSFEFGKEYDVIQFGDVKAGIMICFESYFPTLSRQFALGGADVLIEITNDGYLGKTPVLRQHLAGAVFRALETNRPVLRATNVGITAYIDERGAVSDELEPYSEGWRIWSAAKSDGKQTFYVKYGDWVAWASLVVSLVLLVLSIGKRVGENSAV